LDVILRHAQQDVLCQQCQSPSEVKEVVKAEFEQQQQSSYWNGNSSLAFEFDSHILVSLRPPTSASLPTKSVFFSFWPERMKEATGNFCMDFIGFTSLDKYHKEKDTTKYIWTYLSIDYPLMC
jgi:hypothetical protein